MISFTSFFSVIVCEDLDVGKESIVLVYYKNLMCQRLMVSNLHSTPSDCFFGDFAHRDITLPLDLANLQKSRLKVKN